MQATDLPLTRDLVLIGGGHAHALVLRRWGMDPLAGTRVTLINPGPVAPYTGMLPGHIAGHYPRETLMIDLVRLARFAGARLILDAATGIDTEARMVHLAGRPPLAYDIASIDIGITTDLPDLPGADARAIAAKPLGVYAAAWEAFLTRRLAFPRVVVLGGGVAGVELALASAYRLQALGSRPEVTVIEREAELLTDVGRPARAALMRRMAAFGIRWRVDAVAREIGDEGIVLDSGEVVGSDFTVTATGAQAQGWLAGTGLQHDEGVLVTDATLRTSDPAVFAVGDCATVAGAERPKAGVYAVRAAPVLTHNLRAVLTGGKLRRYRPQRGYLKLVSTGSQHAVADKFGLSVSGEWVWRWKDRIDRKFMAKFADFPAMAVAALPASVTLGVAEAVGDKPLCGGCGAKVGPEALSAALASLPVPQRPEVLSGPGDDAAVLARDGGVQVITTDHLRAFTHDPRVMARITAIHAMGDIWAMGAMPEVALAQITLPRLGPALQARMLSEIMEEAAATFRAAGADVVGGHTSQGAELTIGFTVTGRALGVVGKGGARPGDALVLTRPIGSGTVLAAEMAMAQVPGLLLGEAVAECLAVMAKAQGEAAGLLAPMARAMTDVTGFGLAGHLLEMMEASGTRAVLRLADVPVMRGAEELAAAGVASSLAPANRAATAGRMTATDGARAALLHDPQTAGGLLAAVPAAALAGVMAALAEAGTPAAVIGEVTEGPVWVDVV